MAYQRIEHSCYLGKGLADHKFTSFADATEAGMLARANQIDDPDWTYEVVKLDFPAVSYYPHEETRYAVCVWDEDGNGLGLL